MDFNIFDFVKQLSTSAKELGGLDNTALWALFCLLLVLNTIFERKKVAKRDAAWQKIRIEQAVVASKEADSLQKMADKLAELTIIVSERIPRRD